MNEPSKQNHKKMILVSLTYLTLSILVFTVSVFAWFTLTNVNDASLVQNISGVEAEYEFYIFKDSTNSGSSDLRLMENLCSPTKTDQCYEYIPNPTTMYIVDGFAAPGDRFSFALRIISVGSTSGYIDLEVGNLVSIGYDRIENKIQSAFTHEITKISYDIDGIESEDIKDQSPVIYENGLFNSYWPAYSLVSNAPLLNSGINYSATIIYFDFYFDPTVYGIDSEGLPLTNSNIFMNQVFQIRNIYMTLHP
ncbi:MAG: hypothetical protein JXC35_04990 [Acholeplasmataceae bacterium]|nr:hypothetical protein [Acholeplasmataceae bacterium]